ncbi:hypothetical protein PO902_14210 [Planococcus maritimus]|nr:hypothetical protein [Planococcus sp. SK3692]MDE4086197.1 hypothetical protein [Planococcus maritimus]
MPRMKRSFFENICRINGIEMNDLTSIEVEFRALGVLGYVGMISDRRRDFYKSRTGISFLGDAKNANQNTTE